MIEIFETQRHVYLVMELVTGGELFTRICREKTFSEADAARILGDLCEGLRYLHFLGIVHRDLKVRNDSNSLLYISLFIILSTAGKHPSRVASGRCQTQNRRLWALQNHAREERLPPQPLRHPCLCRARTDPRRTV